MAGILDFLFGPGTPQATDAQGQVTGPAGPPTGGLLGSGFLGQFGNTLSNNSDRLSSFGLGMLSGANQQEGFANALSGMQKGALMDRQRAQLQQAQMEKLQRQKAAQLYAQRFPQYAPLLNANPELADKFAAAEFSKQLNPDDPLDKQLKQARIEALKREAEGGNERFGLNVIWGQDPNGNTVPLQPGDKGTLKQLTLPGGIKVASGVEKVDGGTEWILLDKKTGTVIGRQPKNIEEAGAAEARGKAQGAAQVNLPDASATADQMLTQIDAVKNHPGKYWGTGKTAALGNVPGTDMYDFNERVKQLQGGTFLQSYNTLRGAGAITDIEGQKAQQAIARLNTGLKGKDFDQALDELSQIIKNGQERLRKKASGDFTPSSGATSGSPNRIRYDANGNPL